MVNFFPKTVVISLKKDSKRRDALLPRLERRGFDAEVFGAIEAKDLGENLTRLQIKEKKKNLTASELGCALSHCSIYEALPRDCDYILILEDDVIPLRDNELNFSVGGMVKRGDLMLLGVSSKKEWLAAKRSPQKTTRLGVDWIKLDFFSIFFLKGACAYLLSHDTAKDLLNLQRQELHVADAWRYFFKKRIIKNVFYSEFFKHPEVTVGQSNLELSRMSNRNIKFRNVRRVSKLFVFWSLFVVRGLLGSKYL